jgi:hypothetical protein
MKRHFENVNEAQAYISNPVDPIGQVRPFAPSESRREHSDTVPVSSFADFRIRLGISIP